MLKLKVLKLMVKLKKMGQKGYIKNKSKNSNRSFYNYDLCILHSEMFPFFGVIFSRYLNVVNWTTFSSFLHSALSSGIALNALGWSCHLMRVGFKTEAEMTGDVFNKLVSYSSDIQIFLSKV